MFTRLRVKWILGCTLMSAWVSVCHAQPDVVHRRSGIKQQGEILRYDEKVVEIAVTVAGIRKVFQIPIEEIDRVEVQLKPSHEKGNELFEQSDFRNATRHFEAALLDEQRDWLKAQVWSRLLICYRKTGQPQQALETFSNLGLEDISWSALPVRWLLEPASAAEQAVANRLLQSQSPEQALVGASYLWGSPQAEVAKAKLESLAGTSKGTLQQVARSQLWRWIEKPTPEQVRQWEVAIDRIPADVRGGPKLLLGMARWIHGAPEEAVMSLLWPAMVMQNDPTTASSAAMAAAEILERNGRESEARRVYQLVVRDFPECRYVAHARERIASLKE